MPFFCEGDSNESIAKISFLETGVVFIYSKKEEGI